MAPGQKRQNSEQNEPRACDGVVKKGEEGDTSRSTPTQETRQGDAAWGVPTHKEPRWPASLAVLAVLALYWLLPGDYPATFTVWRAVNVQ